MPIAEPTLPCCDRVKRDYVLGELAKIPGLSCPKPEGAFYVFPVISAYYGESAAIPLSLLSPCAL